MRADAYYEMRKRSNKREEVLLYSYMRYSNTCNSVIEQHECQNMCQYISDQKDCEKLPIGQIKAMTEIHKLLENPNHELLTKLGEDYKSPYSEDLRVYLKLSIAAFDGLLSQYNEAQAKELLLWWATDVFAARLFEDEDREFFILEELFKKAIGDFSASTETQKPFI